MSDLEIAKKIIFILKKKSLSISTMESCTGGLLATTLTNTEGASDIFPGGIVSYSTQTKIAFGVNEGVIKKYGVYSRETALEMARTAKKIFKTNIAIGITGTTTNADFKNSGSIPGEAFFCVIVGKKERTFKICANSFGEKKFPKNLSRKKIKKIFAKKIFDETLRLLEE